MNEKTERVRGRAPKRKLACRRKRRVSKRKHRGYLPEFRLKAVLMCVEGGWEMSPQSTTGLACAPPGLGIHRIRPRGEPRGYVPASLRDLMATCLLPSGAWEIRGNPAKRRFQAFESPSAFFQPIIPPGATPGLALSARHLPFATCHFPSSPARPCARATPRSGPRCGATPSARSWRSPPW